jgi:hypothetical protein
MDKELTLRALDGTEWSLAIHEMNLRMSITAAKISQAAREQPDEMLEVQVMREVFYPVCASVSTCVKKTTSLGEVLERAIPTEEEFFNLPPVDANNWFSVVRDVNPDALPKPEDLLSDEGKAALEEKKESLATKSTPS